MTLAASEEDGALVSGAVPAGLTVAFGSAPCAGGAIRFGDRTLGTGERLVDVASGPVWRRSPWPAADELFAMPPAPPDAPLLVIDADAGRREEAADALAERGVSVLAADRLRRSELGLAATVVFAGDAVFPALLPAAAAAGRLVILPEVAPLFGWQDGIDCLVAGSPAYLVELAVAAARRPQAFDDLRALARLAARPYRASDLYARLAFDLSRSVGAST